MEAPDLSRKQLRGKIPAVYTWLYRHDRDWLDAQPPAAVRPVPDTPRYDWPAIDVAKADALRREAAQLRAQVPLQQITRLALERALGQPGWIEKRLSKLPCCAEAL